MIQEEADRAGSGERELSGPVVRRKMDFSLFYFAADADEMSTNKYRFLLGRIEGTPIKYGFAAVWTPERHFHSVWRTVSQPSGHERRDRGNITSRIQIRAGSVVLPLHDPIRVAEGVVGRRQPITRTGRLVVCIGVARQ